MKSRAFGAKVACRGVQLAGVGGGMPAIGIVQSKILRVEMASGVCRNLAGAEICRIGSEPQPCVCVVVPN